MRFMSGVCIVPTAGPPSPLPPKGQTRGGSRVLCTFSRVAASTSTGVAIVLRRAVWKACGSSAARFSSGLDGP